MLSYKTRLISMSPTALSRNNRKCLDLETLQLPFGYADSYAIDDTCEHRPLAPHAKHYQPFPDSLLCRQLLASTKPRVAILLARQNAHGSSPRLRLCVSLSLQPERVLREALESITLSIFSVLCRPAPQLGNRSSDLAACLKSNSLTLI